MTYLALFSRINFSTWSGHCKKLKLIGNLSDCSQILTVGRLTHKQPKHIYIFFFNESNFCTNTPYFFNPISKMFCNFSLKLNMANRVHVFLAFWARKRRDTLNKRKTKFALTCSVHKVILALAFRGRDKFDNSFLF